MLRSHVQRGPIQLLGRDQRVDAVERDPAVVADDPTAAVGVRQPGDDLGPAGRLDRRRVDVEDPGVVGLAVGGEDLLERRDRPGSRRWSARPRPSASRRTA